MLVGKRTLIAVTALLVSGCAGGLPRCPRNGGRAWRAVTTEHFELLTDLGSGDARASAQDFEYLRAAVTETVAPGWPGPAGRIRVILLATDEVDTFHKLHPAHVGGYFTTYLRQPLIVMPASRRRFDQSVILHELTHYVLDAFIPPDRQPRWVAEGLASYTESLEADRDAGRVTIGKEPAERARFATLKYRPTRIDARDAQALGKNTDGLFYGESWVKVHYLLENHRQELEQFLAGLRSGQAEPQSWASAFPSMTQQDLDGKMTAYIRDGRHLVVTLRLPFRPGEVQERPLSDAEFHVWRAALYLTRFRESDAADKARARDEIADALHQDPTLPDALATRVDLGDPVGLDELRHATVAHPEHWIAWYLFANALRQANQPTTADQAMKEARRLAEWNPAVRLDDSGPRRHEGS